MGLFLKGSAAQRRRRGVRYVGLWNRLLEVFRLDYLADDLGICLIAGDPRRVGEPFYWSAEYRDGGGACEGRLGPWKLSSDWRLPFAKGPDWVPDWWDAPPRRPRTGSSGSPKDDPSDTPTGA